MTSDTTPFPASKQVAGPTCGGPSLYSAANPYRPFCSRRCRDIDLGAWAAEEFRVPDAEPDAGLPPDGDQAS